MLVNRNLLFNTRNQKIPLPWAHTNSSPSMSKGPVSKQVIDCHSCSCRIASGVSAWAFLTLAVAWSPPAYPLWNLSGASLCLHKTSTLKQPLSSYHCAVLPSLSSRLGSAQRISQMFSCLLPTSLISPGNPQTFMCPKIASMQAHNLDWGVAPRLAVLYIFWSQAPTGTEVCLVSLSTAWLSCLVFSCTHQYLVKCISCLVGLRATCSSSRWQTRPQGWV